MDLGEETAEELVDDVVVEGEPFIEQHCINVVNERTGVAQDLDVVTINLLSHRTKRASLAFCRTQTAASQRVLYKKISCIYIY